MPPRQRKQDKRDEKRDDRLIALIAAALAVGASAQATATNIAPKIGLPLEAVKAAVQVALSRPLAYARGVRSAPATAQASRLEATYRAAYVLAASRRIAAGGPVAKERDYFNQHLNASRNRRSTAAAVDKMSRRYGNELGWYARMDQITSEECRAANGKNFRADEKPAIGYPGDVHPHCRCKPGKPHATSQTVYAIKPDRKAA